MILLGMSFPETKSEEIRVLVSMYLWLTGHESELQFLLNSMLKEPSERYASLLALCFERSNCKEAGEVLLKRLEDYLPEKIDLGKSFESNSSKDLVVAILYALQTLKIELPLFIKEKFSSVDIPVEISSLVLKAI